MVEGKKIHVVHLITGLRSGGAENMLFRLLRNIDHDKFHCTVISLTDEGALASEFRAIGITVHVLEIRSIASLARGVVRLIRYLNANPCDIIQTWLYHADFMGLLVSLAKRGAKLLWNIRCSEVTAKDVPLTTLMLTRVLRIFSFVPDMVIVNSKAGLEFHKSIGYRPSAWHIIYNGFDLSRFSYDLEAGRRMRLSIGIPEGKPVVGFIARYDPMKDFPTFLRAMQIVAQRIPEVRIVMAGGGVTSQNKTLSGFCSEYGILDKVMLLGERTDIPALLSSFDVLVSSSRSEGFPNVIGEAMASSIPCVATKVGDTEILLGECGRLLPPESPEGLAEAVIELIEMPHEKRSALGRKARERIAEKFSMEVSVNQYEHIYESIARGILIP
jgi:glycosyltransferase involved in cell wall biosynthesis